MRLVLTSFITAALVLSCFGQENEQVALKELNTKVVNAIRANNFQVAEEMATQLIALSTKLNGATGRDTAIAHMNLAYSQKEQKKLDEAVQNYQTAINILEKLDNIKRRDLIDAYEGLAHAYFLHDNSKLAMQSYLNAISAAERSFGAESKQSYASTLNVANIFLLNKDYEKANEFFIKSYALALRHYEISSQEVERVEDIRMCSAISRHVSEEQNKAFSDVRKNLVISGGGGILNGKALSLPRPAYPVQAKISGISGTVVVRVKINEAGSVFDVSPVCGHPLLRAAAVTAAAGAKFAPTLLEGNPVVVSGVITYNFVAP
jgi:TonB family protein